MKYLKTRRHLCPACGKRSYATATVAQADMRRIQAVSAVQPVPIRVYACTRGWWHLTSSDDPMDLGETG